MTPFVVQVCQDDNQRREEEEAHTTLAFCHVLPFPRGTLVCSVSGERKVLPFLLRWWAIEASMRLSFVSFVTAFQAL